MYYVYILKSSKSHTLYYGYTQDIKKRLHEHNTGKSNYTKTLRPWILVWYGAFQTEKQAKDFELYIKSGSGKAFAYKRLVALKKEDFLTQKGVPKS